MQHSQYIKEVTKLLASLDGRQQENTEPQQETPIPETQEPIEDIYVLILREREEDGDEQVVDSTLSDLDTAPLPIKPTPQPVTNAFIGALLLGLLVPLFCIALQLYFIANPFTVTVLIAAKTHYLSFTGTVQLGRVLNPITVSQSATASTTGHGHQDAKQATGTVTFYNGQLTSVFIPSGTLLTGNSGEQIVTDADANIPAESGSIPPTLGQTTVPSHAVTPGSKGNIPLGDINQGCCATAIKVVNTSSFSGGQDARDFQIVTKTDISNAATPLQGAVTQGINEALHGQLKTNEALVSPSCPITTTADHQPGQEATQVKVTVSETCSGIAYDTQALETNVTAFLTTQAIKKLGAGYSILETPHITVTHATPAKRVLLSFTSISTWVYAFTSQEQNTIKKIIAGKTKEQALQRLDSLPGTEQVSMHFAGFGDDTSLPKNLSTIHLTIIYGI